MENRLNQRLVWYDQKATNSKYCYLILKIITVFCSASVPLLSSSKLSLKDIVGRDFVAGNIEFSVVVSTVVAILVALESILHNKEQWRNYRRTKQCLMREYYDFTSGKGVYLNINNENDAFHEFVERVEGIIATENDETLRAKTSGYRQYEEKPNDSYKKIASEN